MEMNPLKRDVFGFGANGHKVAPGFPTYSHLTLYMKYNTKGGTIMFSKKKPHVLMHTGSCYHLLEYRYFTIQ